MEEEKLNTEAQAENEAVEENAEETAAPAAEEVEEAAEEETGKKKKHDRKEEKKSEKLTAELEAAKAELAAEKDSRLRLAAEYDNYRKRTMKEKDSAYQDGVAATIKEILPIYDNLERALAQATEDEAYKKGVEMIMTAMKNTLAKSGIEAFGEPGESFDPEHHNAVMHTEDESLGENVITDVFQKGFRKGEKVIRFAMVKVAN